MEFHRGRLIDHVHLRVRDLEASKRFYRAVLEAKARKPVIASMGDVAASGGYYVAMGADEILANPTTITGSITRTVAAIVRFHCTWWSERNCERPIEVTQFVGFSLR